MGKRSVTGRLSVIFFLILITPGFASAQRGGSAVSAPAAGGHSAPLISHAPAAPAGMHAQSGTHAAARIGSPIVRSRNGTRIVHRATASPIDFNGTDFQDVPGLGFDYPHLAAVSGNRRLHASRFHNFNNGFPFGFSGFLLSPPVIVEQAPATESESAAEEQEAIDGVSDEPSDAPGPRRHARVSRQSSQPQPEAAPAPLPEAEQYVFVRRDGTLVFAVGYAWENGTLRYITPDGFRRSLAREALDLSATRQFNEQRGLNFHAPA